MKTELWLVTYNGMIGHPDLAVAGDLLFGQPGPSFGGAIEGFELYAHVDHHGPPLPTLDSMLARYRERLATLPRVWFRRKRRLIEVAYHSRLGAARELLDGEPKAAEVSTIRAACGEIADVLGGMIPKSVKRSDVFDAGAFVAFHGSRRSVIEVASDGEIRAMLDRARGAVGRAASGGSRGDDVAGGGPAIVAINHDDYHAKHVGRTADGRQFFLTTPFVPADGAEPGREFVALFLFDGSGRLVEAKIDDLGPRAELDEEAARRVYDARLAELGEVTFGRIEVAPFSVVRFGTEFGLIPREPEHEGDVWAVEMRPGNYMAFYEPWDGGDYDT